MLALTLPIIAAACQPSPPQAAAGGEPTIIASDDGQATLLLPPGALPEGVSPGDMSITLVDQAQLPFTFEDEDGGSLVAYRLEPEGLELLEPATIELEFEGDGALPLLWHVSARDIEQTGAFTVELVEGMSVELDLSTGRGSVSAPLAHFSWLLNRRSDFWLYIEVSLEEVGPRAVGETFTVSAVVALRAADRRFINSTDTQMVVSVDLEVPWPLQGEFLSWNPALSPGRIADAPSSTQVIESFTAVGTFTCTQSGSGRLYYEAYIIDPVATVTRVIRITSGRQAGEIHEHRERRRIESPTRHGPVAAAPVRGVSGVEAREPVTATGAERDWRSRA